MESADAELPAQSRELLAQIERLAKERNSNLSQTSGEIRLTRRDLTKATGWSYWQIRTYIAPLIEQGYLWVRQGKRGLEYYYDPSADQ